MPFHILIPIICRNDTFFQHACSLWSNQAVIGNPFVFVIHKTHLYSSYHRISDYKRKVPYTSRMCLVPHESVELPNVSYNYIISISENLKVRLRPSNSLGVTKVSGSYSDFL